MTPKEQARELFDKFLDIMPTSSNAYVELMAKECSLRAVTFIINANPHSNPFNTNVHSTMHFWIKVKKEIENI